MAHIIDGKALAQSIKEDLKEKIKTFPTKPTLAVLLVGNNPASEIYVNFKEKACKEVGITSHVYHYKDTLDFGIFLEKIAALNADPSIHGILLQLPLPAHFDAFSAIHAIHSMKDADGLHGLNLGWLMHKHPYTIPCTPQGCMRLIQEVASDLSGMHAVVIGRSILVGQPMATLLTHANATVTLAHSKTKNLKEICQTADILIAAAGVPHLVTKDYVKKSAIVIDVGIHRKSDGRLCGDVAFDEVIDDVYAITPVPGGVGPMTVACLLKNTVYCYEVLQGMRRPHTLWTD
jgi:methylenetetrahydrofolate dehydrogenase (NADP+)/methenyltetrahydrofolate cyclohydrolase